MTGKRRRTAASIMMMAAAGLAACDGINDPSQAGNLVPKTVDEDATIPSLALAGTVFHHETFGDPTKPAVIFLHGGPGGDGRDMRRLLDRQGGYALTDDYFVVTWDQRGSGLSRRHDCDWYRTYFYSDAKDGWYSGTGGTLHAGAKGGVTIGRVEIVLRAGVTRTEALNDLDLPFYGTLGANVRF